MTASELSLRSQPTGRSELIGRPVPHEGIGCALRNAFSAPRTEALPCEIASLLDRLR